MIKYLFSLVLVSSLSGCVVLPYKDTDHTYQCALSTDKKVLKVVNLTEGDTSFYQWNEEFMAIITVPTTAVISGIYVIVNNTYHIGEKLIKCN
ncbi:hypothetical protein ACOYR1_13480 [Thalassotalea piscium]